MQRADEEKIYTLALSFIPSIGPAKFKLMEDFFESIKDAWLAKETDLLKSGIGQKATTSLIKNRKEISPQQKAKEVFDLEISFITRKDPSFPKLLKEIHSCPFILFYEGSLKALNNKTIAIVGPRLPTHYGENVATKFASELSLAGITIVSGMAQGVDSIAHLSCVQRSRPTIAVLGCGIERAKNQNSNRRLIDSIISTEGLILSEYPPLTKSAKHTFPARNRIVSGLSNGTIVIEASQRSGTLITARLTLEQNRELFVVPGNIFSEKSIGTNELLKKGAMPTTCVEDVFNCLNFKQSSTQKQDKVIELEDKLEQSIYQKLSLEPIHIDTLARITNINHSTLLSKLSILELSNLAQNIGGGMFVRK